MYKTIVVTLDATPTDRAIIEHVKELAAKMGSSVVLLHVATGVPAQFHGDNAGGQEVEEDKAYLDRIRLEFESVGVTARAELAFGDPVREIVRRANETGCDLVAMSTHGHKGVADLVLGSTANQVRHKVDVPVLLVRGKLSHAS
ncbi:MAG TPA: universal stress protein [Candidatus Acidoferrales bacterium]|nr:universal stress protein [Candidatus Acidoferrales bacterium]